LLKLNLISNLIKQFDIVYVISVSAMGTEFRVGVFTIFSN
jgi:hypothetical protein